MVDYSVWAKIDVSDDEDDTHPCVDTPSLFRLRHEARVDRMREVEEAKRGLGELRGVLGAKKEELRRKKEIGGDGGGGGEEEEALRKLEVQVEAVAKEVEMMEKQMPWNVDTLSTEKFSKSFVNKGGCGGVSKGTQEDYEAFVEKNGALLESFGKLPTLLESKKFLEEFPALLSTCTSEFLLKEAIGSLVEEREEATDRLCMQCVTIHLLIRMGEELGRSGDLKSLLPLFFTRIAQELPAFHEEVKTLRGRVQIEADDRAREIRMGPGGLDPLVVAEELPEDLRQCFILRDEELLKTVVGKMDEEEAERIMKRCVDAGLWIPGTSKTSNDEEVVETSNSASKISNDEEVVETSN